MRTRWISIGRSWPNVDALLWQMGGQIEKIEVTQIFWSPSFRYCFILTKAGVTRLATYFLTPKIIHEQRVWIRLANYIFIKRMGRKFIFKEDWWHQSKGYCTVVCRVLTLYKVLLKICNPLVKVFRLVDSERSTMGYIYEVMDRTKEAIAKSFNNVKKRNGLNWKIIDKAWNLQLHCPFHVPSYFLNLQSSSLSKSPTHSLAIILQRWKTSVLLILPSPLPKKPYQKSA